MAAPRASTYTIYIDEAGRGACVGPLVYGALVVRQDVTELDALWVRLPPKAKRARDSKAMTEKAREIYFQAMLDSCSPVSTESVCEAHETPCKRAAFMTHSTSALDITQALLFDHNEHARHGRATSVNLNTLSYDATAQLILCAVRWILRAEEDNSQTGPHEVHLDVVADRLGHDATSHEEGVWGAMTRIGACVRWNTFRSEPRADDNYKGVSIASVAAKVTRDRAVGGDVAGHGYPNPACSAWIVQNVRHPDPRIRYSWDNVQRILPQLNMNDEDRARYTILSVKSTSSSLRPPRNLTS